MLLFTSDNLLNCFMQWISAIILFNTLKFLSAGPRGLKGDKGDKGERGQKGK